MAVDIAKVGQGSSKRYVDSRSVVRVISDQGEAIGRLNETIVNDTKDISIMSTTMGGMAQDLQSYGKEMEYHSAKLHQVEKNVEVSHMFFLWNFKKTDKDFMVLFGSISYL